MDHSIVRLLLLAAVLLVVLITGPASALAWQIETVPGQGWYSSLALDDTGNPRISYYNPSSIELSYAWRDGFNWHAQTVEPVPAGAYTSLELDSAGSPCISYGGNPNLKYAWHNYDGWHVELVDSANKVGLWTSLALDGAGNPRISYYDDKNGDLKYAWRDGAGWHFETVVSTGYVGMYSSLALDGAGNPRISYYDGNPNFDLKYAWRDSAGWHLETVDSAGNVMYTSLALNGADNPRISYYDGNTQNLKYAWRDGAGWHLETVDSTGFGFAGTAGTSLALDADGNSRIAYGGDLGLKYAWYNATGWHTETVDSTVALGGYAVSLALDGAGNPRISYQSLYEQKHKYAWAGISPPVADFSANVTTGTVPLAVQFIDGSTIGATAWSWEFGDGGTADVQNPVHVYASAGTYTVNLTAIYGDGADSETKVAYITVHSLNPPVADFTANVTAGTVPLAVQFTDSSTNGPTTWSWEFGDGATSTGQNPVHVYTSAGTYSVNLTATNADGIDTETKPGFISVVQSLPGAPAAPTDTDGDGLFDDVNGNGRADFTDVVLYFNQMAWIAGNEPVSAFDYNGNGRIDFADVVWLFNHL